MSNSKEFKKAFWFMIPTLILLLIFVVYPIIKTIILSFIEPSGSVGLANYSFVYNQEAFRVAIYNTSIYTFFVTIIEMVISLIIAYALLQKIKFKNTFQVILFLPYVTSVIAVGTVFKVMYNYDYGIINQVLIMLGGDPVKWLGEQYGLVSMILLGVWKGLAFNILIIYTALLTIDPNLEKAALIDGSSSIKTFLKVKLPQIKGVLLYILTINIIFNIKVYEEVVSLFGTITPGPGGSANTIVYMIYKTTTTDPKAAAVLAVTLLVIVLIIRQLMKLIFD